MTQVSTTATSGSGGSGGSDGLLAAETSTAEVHDAELPAGELPVGEVSASERTLRAALDVSPDGFAVHLVHRDGQGRADGFSLESINTAGAAPHSAGAVDLIGRDLTELLPDAEGTGIPEAFRRAADTGIVQKLRTSYDSDDWSGTMDLLVARVDAHRIVATWRDVTDQVRSEQVLVDAYTRAQAAWDCLYGVLDAVEDTVLLLDVEAVEPVATDGTTTVRRARTVVKYLNAAAAGARDRGILVGRDLGDVRPDLETDHVLDLVRAAATDRPGCVRQLVLSSADGTVLGSFAASLAPTAAPAAHAVPTDNGTVPVRRGVVLVAKQTPS
ncbi:MAG: hypothetical protein HY830_17180 [Actinobacteria bacterium]|nr:hypothetical protein [Actinomycetota bacterium]